jgi:antitoxin (DNA-binding transcriptional repressor) of toxin-antitoxin stability system
VIKASVEIGAYEAKTKLPEILRRVESGERFIITKRGVPVAEMRPVGEDPAPSARQAVASMRNLPKISGVSTTALRRLIEQGRR